MSYQAESITLILSTAPILAVVFLGWFLGQWKIRKPKLKVELPGLYYKPQFGRVRLRVANTGSVEAKNAMVKLRLFDPNGTLVQEDILHWSRNMEYKTQSSDSVSIIYSPITIFSKDSEFLDLFIASQKKETWWGFYAYPYLESEAGALPHGIPEWGIYQLKGEVKVYADGARPVKFTFYCLRENMSLKVRTNPENLKEITLT